MRGEVRLPSPTRALAGLGEAEATGKPVRSRLGDHQIKLSLRVCGAQRLVSGFCEVPQDGAPLPLVLYREF